MRVERAADQPDEGALAQLGDDDPSGKTIGAAPMEDDHAHGGPDRQTAPAEIRDQLSSNRVASPDD